MIAKMLKLGFAERIIFKIRTILGNIWGKLFLVYYRILGMQIGKNTTLSRFFLTWPHQIAIGDDCLLEHNIYFHFDGIYKPGPSIKIGNCVFVGNGCEFNIREAISVGNDCLIGAGCRFIDHDHAFSIREVPMRQQSNGPQEPIDIGDDVWLGANVIVLKGANIGRGAVVAAGAVVTRSIPEFEIWGGVPAKKIGQRV